MMIDKESNDLLKVSELQIYNMFACGDWQEVLGKVKNIMDQFMRFANYRRTVESRYIPAGLDFSINHMVNSRGQGFFSTNNHISISIPYFKLNDYYAKTQEERAVYRDYLFSIFEYKIIWADSISKLQNSLEKLIESFNEDNKDKWSTVKRPIGYAFQQLESHMPQPALGGFTSRYNYIGILLYEEICRDKGDFLITTHQVYRVGEREEMAWYWNDGREIGKHFDEDIKKFSEEEGLIFDEPTIIMRDSETSNVVIVKENP